MPSSRDVVPDGAPAQLLEFLRAHPGSHIADAMLALGLPQASAYYALTRLRDLKLIKRLGRWNPARWKVVGTPPVDPSRLAERHPVLADFTAPILQARSIDAAAHPTGTPFAIVGGVMRASSGDVQTLGISGPRLSSSEYQSPGSVHLPGVSHPWGFLSNRKGR